METRAVIPHNHNAFSRFLFSKPLEPIPDEREPCIIDEKPYMRIMWTWMDKILRRGYDRVILPQDIPLCADAETMKYRFGEYKRYLQKDPPTTSSQYRELWAMLYAMRWRYIFSFSLKLIQTGCSIGLSLISRKLIEEAEGLVGFQAYKNYGPAVGYIIGLCLIDVLLLLSNLASFYTSIMNSEMSRTLAMACIHDKMLRLGPQQRHDFSAAKIMTISSSDCRRASSAIIEINSVLALPVFMGATIGVLIYLIGVSGLPGIGMLLIGLVLSSSASFWVSDLRLKSMPFQDMRVSITRETLKNINIIKFYGWEEPFLGLLKSVRSVETRFIRLIELVDAFNIAVVIATPNLAGALSFAVKIIISLGLNPAGAFPALTLFQMFQPVFAQVSFGLTTLADAVVAFRRMNTFFRLPEVPSYIEDLCESDSDLRTQHDDIVGRIVNASFAWTVGTSVAESDEGGEFSSNVAEGSEKVVLSDVNLSLVRGSMNLVVGAVGSGKSSLLAAFINTIPKSAGSVQLQNGLRVTSVLSQWSQNASVRDNILIGGDYDAKRFAEVVRVCDLKSDFDLFSHGDHTDVGENGVTLSGGQRARLALARCLYADGDVIVLDDVLSAMDSRVGNHIYRELLKLAHERQKTILFSTNNLKLVPTCDSVIVLDGEGHATQSLPADAKLVSIAHQSRVDKQDEEELKDEAEMEISKAHAQIQPHMQETAAMLYSGLGDSAAIAMTDFHEAKEHLHDLEKPHPFLSEESQISKVMTCASSIGDLEKGEAAVNVHQMEEENRAIGTVKVGVIIRYFRLNTAWGLAAFIGIVILLASFATSESMANVILNWWTSNKFHKSQGFNLGMYTLDVSLNACFYALFASLLSYLATASSSFLHNQAVQGLYSAPMSFFQVNPLGRLLMRFTEDLVNLDTRLLAFARMTFMTVFTMLSGIIVVFVYIPWTILCLVPIFVITYVMMTFYRTVSRELNRCQQLYDSKGITSISEHIEGQEVIVAYGRATSSQQRLNTRLDDVISATMHNEAANFWMASRCGFLCEIVNIMTLFLAVFNVFNLNASEVGMMISLLPNIRNSLTMIFPLYALFENQLNSVERLDEYARELPVEGGEMHNKERHDLENWEATHGKIDFESVSLRYRPDLPLVLNKLSINLGCGKKIGICGRTGAGKSTIISALFRLVELADGRITIDGQDISELPLPALRRALAIIPQSPVLFQGTVRSNLDPFEELSDNELVQALEHSGLCVTADDGKFALSAPVEAEGTNFSLGQRQMLALARVVVRHARILVLDEATAAVDQATDERIQAAVKTQFRDCTVLCIAHRLETILDYDEILVMGSGGVMLEMGPPSELLAKGAVFAEMCREAGIKF